MSVHVRNCYICGNGHTRGSDASPWVLVVTQALPSEICKISHNMLI